MKVTINGKVMGITPMLIECQPRRRKPKRDLVARIGSSYYRIKDRYPRGVARVQDVVFAYFGTTKRNIKGPQPVWSGSLKLDPKGVIEFYEAFLRKDAPGLQ